MAKDLNKLSPDELGNLFPIIITEYNPDWKNLFISEKETIKKAVGVRNLIRVEHIGSTAIPGICAKPTIDILLEIKDNTDTESIITDLKNIGYFFTPKPENPPPHMMFMKGYSNNGFTGQAFHVHVRYKGDWDELVFRDYLIQNYKTAQEYGKLKLRLAAEYTNDREKYTNNKSDFITSITKMARKETKNKIYDMKQDWRKTDRKFYLPGTEPELIKIPSFRFFTIEGNGDPNDKFFADYIGVLYSLSYAVKMSPKIGSAPKDYFDFTVYPLEGLWDISEEAKLKMAEKLDKKSLIFNLMIRQPEFVTEAFALETIERTKKKKPHPLLEKIKFCTIEDSDCIQMMHLGSYDNEPASFKKMEDFCGEINVFRESKRHREIYLSDARKVSPDKLKTVLRFKIIKTDKA